MMQRSLPIFLLLALYAPVTHNADAGESKPNTARPTAEGRLLYANDDDWNWGTPKGAKRVFAPAFPVLKWAALDWMEEGLEEVDAVFICGKSFGLSGLKVVRRQKSGPRSYRRVNYEKELFTRLLDSGYGKVPNVVLLMQNRILDDPPTFTQADALAVARYLQKGGRLIILDDFGYYKSLLGHVLAELQKGTTRPTKPSARVRALMEAKVTYGRNKLTNRDLDKLPAELKKRVKAVEVRPIIRDHTKDEGRAMLVRIARVESKKKSTNP